jgi:hypothetical protein
MDPIYILTAELDPDSFVLLDALRAEHFPPERNLLPAHLTLFHRLSSAQAGRLAAFERPSGPVPVQFDAPLLLGFGVAIQVRSPDLGQVRAAARAAMGGEFSRQDSQAWGPHVTIQNKVPAETARQLHRALISEFAQRDGTVTGLLLWEYLGGPWKLLERLPFDRMAGVQHR